MSVAFCSLCRDLRLGRLRWLLLSFRSLSNNRRTFVERNRRQFKPVSHLFPPGWRQVSPWYQAPLPSTSFFSVFDECNVFVYHPVESSAPTVTPFRSRPTSPNRRTVFTCRCPGLYTGIRQHRHGLKALRPFLSLVLLTCVADAAAT